VTGIEGGYVRALAIDPLRPRTMFAATLEAGVFKSTDGGASWQPLNIASTAARAEAIVIAAGEPQTIYAGTGGGIFKSTDDGGTWKAANSGLFGKESARHRGHRLVEGYVVTLIVDPRTPETVYASAGERGLLKSTNAGGSWRPLGLTGSGPAVLDPNDPEIIYVGQVYAFASGDLAKSGVVKSTDGGNTWSVAGLAGRNVDALAIDPQHSETVYAGTAAGIFKTSDGGESWHVAWQAADPDTYIAKLTLDPHDPETVYAAVSPDGVLKSTDGGRTWKTLKARGDVSDVALDPRNSRTLYAGTSAGFLKSTDAGRSWGVSNAGLTGARVTTLAVDTRNPGTAYALVASQGVFKRTDGKWRVMLTNSNAAALAVDPRNGTVYVEAEGAMFKSTDGAASWRRVQPLPIPKSRSVVALAVDPQNPKNVYAGTWESSNDMSGSRVYKSRDAGASWREIPAEALLGPGDTFALAFDPLDPETLYAGGAGVFKTADGGATWQDLHLVGTFIYALALDPKKPTTIYAGTSAGLSKSTDGGSRWRGFHVSPKDLPVFSLAVNPRARQTVYAGTEHGLFRSVDGGRAWRRAKGVPPRSISALAVDPSGDILYVGVNGGGVFELKLGH
jgi:photosystem II stability/assembly factor-like uncharacterized protein